MSPEPLRAQAPRKDAAMVARRPTPELMKKLSPDERAWLEKRLREYKRLLEYLRDH
jgi:hypothetical protein